MILVFYLIWRLCTVVQRYLSTYMPTNIAIRWLKIRRGLKWAMPAACVLTPAYLAAADGCTTWLANGGPRWLNLLAVLFIWNGMKFATLGLLSPLLRAVISENGVARQVGVWRHTDDAGNR